MSGIHDGHRERMRQQYKQNGLTVFQPHQIVEMLLFYAIPRKDTNETAHRLLDTYHTLSGVLSASYDSLCSVPGMTPGAALFVRFCGDLIRQYGLQEVDESLVLDTADKVRAFVAPQFVGEKNERLLLLCLNAKNRLLFNGFVSEGTISATEIHVRKIMEKALSNQASAVILAHNHPAGFARPSLEDRHATQVVGMVLASVGITLLDHCIVAGSDCLSMRSLPQSAALFKQVATTAEHNRGAPPTAGGLPR